MKIMIVVFLGADGSGKSTILKEFTRRVRSDWSDIQYVHFRPTYLYRGEITNKPVIDPHSGRKRGTLISLIKLLYFVFEYNYAFHFRYKRSNNLVVFDRYYYDVIADPKRIKISTPLWVAKFLAKFIPQPDLVFYISASVETLYSRKQEVKREALEQISKRYFDLAKHYSFYTVSSETSFKITMDNVLSIYNAHRTFLKGKIWRH